MQSHYSLYRRLPRRHANLRKRSILSAVDVVVPRIHDIVGPQHDDTFVRNAAALDVSAGVGQARTVGEAPRPALLKRDDVYVHRRVVVLSVRELHARHQHEPVRRRRRSSGEVPVKLCRAVTCKSLNNKMIAPGDHKNIQSREVNNSRYGASDMPQIGRRPNQGRIDDGKWVSCYSFRLVYTLYA
jgi:hypothetical protein